jgi:hypothetical protein
LKFVVNAESPDLVRTPALSYSLSEDDDHLEER